MLDRLLVKHDHPTAFTLYEELIKQIPTLSKTSIYNTLDIFMENGLVNPIIMGEAETRFDIITEKHGHFKCNKCNNIFDFPIEESKYTNLEDFEIIEEDIQLYGICNNCK